MKTLLKSFLLLWMLVISAPGQAGLNVIIKGNTVISGNMDGVIPLPFKGTLNTQKLFQACAWANYVADDTLVYDVDNKRCLLYADFVAMMQPDIDNVWMLDTIVNASLPVLLNTLFDDDSTSVVLYDSIQGCVAVVGETICPPAIAIAVAEGGNGGSSGGGGTNPPTNHAPVASSQSVSLDQDTSKSILLVAYDQDSDALSYTIVTQPANGSLSGTAPNVSYKPTVGYSGADTFTFRVSDGKLNSNIATVSISVNPVVQLPVVNTLTARAKDSKVSLLWTALAGVDAYNVYRSTAQGGPYQLIAADVITSYATYLDTSVSNGTTYYYVVTSKVSGKESSYSNEASATPSARTR